MIFVRNRPGSCSSDRRATRGQLDDELLNEGIEVCLPIDAHNGDAVALLNRQQAIRKAFDIDWRPAHFLASTAQSIPTALVPAGLEKAMGIISSSSSKDPNDPRWAGDKDVQDYIAFKKSYFPEGDPTDALAQGGYRLPQMMLRLLDKCGNNLTRENLMYWRLT